VCVILSVTTAVNISVCAPMGGRLRWLWLSGSPPLIFLLCVLLSVESVYGKIKFFFFFFFFSHAHIHKNNQEFYK